MLHSSLTKASEKQFHQIRSEVKKAYNEEKDGITNIAVTFDGTWLTRGHTSQTGIGCVIDMLTGYTSVLSDGDSKAFQHLTETKVYGDIEIKKEECVNHVSKLLGTALQNCVKEWRSRGVTLGGKSHGSLKEKTIQKLTQYYQNAILKNKGNADKIKTAIYATLYHSISTDKKPQHFKCPSGQESRCFYQAAIASGITPGSHKELVKTPVNEAHLAKYCQFTRGLYQTNY
ncbi:hypothetical protein AVEN_54458-1 [Araneus ventricosus]|uniref:Mutator-like transposase domain-containing protein n=1 Tax=Araneus ventricosus TaxID=182803 RepID=A0A4Y2L796_ARAVE|nr:hypothetical protein AVEN_54458-1 [Araneus ventricosus]